MAVRHIFVKYEVSRPNNVACTGGTDKRKSDQGQTDDSTLLQAFIDMYI